MGRQYPDQFEVRLLDCDESGAGEMLARGRAVCMGYLNNKEKTLETIDDEVTRKGFEPKCI